jgi:8-oxo-dGTP diphosphatase
MRRIVLAAGTVALREGPGTEPEVLLVHRPRYNDWSLPKGKLDENEYLAACAVRETWEETGVLPLLSQPLPAIEYPIVGGTKRVHYWLATERSSDKFVPNDEVDKIRWLPASRAIERVSYPEEPGLIRQALGLAADSVAVVVLRHATAQARLDWGDDDDSRPLSKYGKRQAKNLVPLLGAFGVRRLITSTAKRCRKTLKPYAKSVDGQLEATHALSESESWQEPDQVKTVMRRALRQAIEHHEPVAICGHQPTLPLMLASLGVAYRAMRPATAAVVHFSPYGETLSAEFFDPVV